MMLTIHNLLQDHNAVTDWNNIGNAFDRYIELNNDEYYLLVSYFTLIDKASINKLLAHYCLQEVYELSNCFLGTCNQNFVLWHVTKTKPSIVKIAVFYDRAIITDDLTDKTTGLRVPDSYSDKYLKYLYELEEWSNNNNKPNDIDSVSEFIEIKNDEFDNSIPHPRFYAKSNDEIRKLLHSETIVRLKDVAEIIDNPLERKGVSAKRVTTLNPDRSPLYPYFPNLNTIESFSHERIHKGDIVELRQGVFFLVDKESSSELYAPLGSHIIRVKNVCAEYLYLYLNSKIAHEIKKSLTINLDDTFTSSGYDSLSDFPVVLPQNEDSVYKDQFLKLSRPKLKLGLRLKLNNTQNRARNERTFEQVLVMEWLDNVTFEDNRIEEQIRIYIKESKACYDNGLFYAAIIMLGSILEAFLIDWLSELKGVDYYNEDLQKRKFDYKNNRYITDDDGNYVYKENSKAGLYDYIQEIKDIKSPDWDSFAEKAHYIRENRNLIHLKKRLENNEVITAETYKKIQDDLIAIIQSRWENYK